MAISYVGSLNTGGNGGTLSINFSSLNPQAGDIVILSIGARLRAPSQNFIINTSGYTTVCPNPIYSDLTFDMGHTVAYKIMGATPDTSVSVTSQNASTSEQFAFIVYILRGVDTSNPIDVTSTYAQGTYAVVNNPSITPVTSGAVVLITGVVLGDNTGISFTAPSGYGNKVECSHACSSGYKANLCIATKNWSSGAEDPASWTPSDNESTMCWAGVTMALRPSVNLANLKSYNTNLKANIKSINGNPIANVKSLNTNV